MLLSIAQNNQRKGNHTNETNEVFLSLCLEHGISLQKNILYSLKNGQEARYILPNMLLLLETEYLAITVASKQTNSYEQVIKISNL